MKTIRKYVICKVTFYEVLKQLSTFTRESSGEVSSNLAGPVVILETDKVVAPFHFHMLFTFILLWFESKPGRPFTQNAKDNI